MSEHRSRRILRLGEGERAVGLLSMAAAAKFLAISENHFRKEVLPALPLVQIGSRSLVDIEDVCDWIDAHKRMAHASPAIAVGRNPMVTKRVQARTRRLLAKAQRRG